MLPRWHVLLGLLFTIVFSMVFPETLLLYAVLIFLSSIFIDLDHYLNAVVKTSKINIFHAFTYYKSLDCFDKYQRSKGIKQRSDFQPLHTLEFHLLILLLGFLWAGFFYLTRRHRDKKPGLAFYNLYISDYKHIINGNGGVCP